MTLAPKYPEDSTMTAFDNLAPMLLQAIPDEVRQMKLAKPLAILRIYYYDTHAPCTYLTMRTISSECRSEVVASKGQNAPFTSGDLAKTVATVAPIFQANHV